MEKRVISTQIQEEDLQTETSLRPMSLEEYIGQEKIKGTLRVYIEAARRGKEPLDHVLVLRTAWTWKDNTFRYHCQ